MPVPTTRMESTQFVIISITPKNRRGQPAPLDPNVPLVWVNTDPSILTLTPGNETAAPFTCRVDGAGAGGSDAVQFVADADMGDGNESFVITCPFEVTP